MRLLPCLESGSSSSSPVPVPAPVPVPVPGYRAPRSARRSASPRPGAARRSAATGQLLPQVRANASLSDNTRVQSGQETTFDGNRYSLQLTQVLFNWQAFAARAQAVLREDQAEQLYYSELAILLTDVAEKYFDALQARDALDSIASEYEAVSNQLEQIESLEQLRALWHGYRIAVHQTQTVPGGGVDTPADLARVRAIFEGRT